MTRRTVSVVAALAFASLASLTSALAQKSSLTREKGAIYVEDFMEKAPRLKLKQPAPAYADIKGQRTLGTLLAGQSVELIAFSDKACRVRGKATHDDVVGWVGSSFLQADDPALFDRMKAASDRQKQVQALIDKKEVAIGMTPEEVVQSLGKPDEETSDIKAGASASSYSYVTFDRVPQRNLVRDRTGRVLETITYIKVETGRTTVTFENGSVSGIQTVKGKPRWDNTRIVVPPIFIR